MGTYSYSGSPVFITVTTTGVYDINAFGAQGGGSSTYGGVGGRGAEEGGTINLTAGERLEIVVGGYGHTRQVSGGGGGGTFVLANTGAGGAYVPLLVAGGGGGGYHSDGGVGTVGAAGDGSGGTATGNRPGGGGSGVQSNGATNPDALSGLGGYNRSGNYAGGLTGGGGGDGGFGGGGGGGIFGGGGGGGYTGGSAVSGGDSSGGTSFDSGIPITAQTVAGTNSGNGSLTITPSVACYCPGTLVLTNRGEVPVEILAIGDTVVTASGQQRPIKWIGHRTLNCRSHPNTADSMPIRIAAGALGVNKPARDLTVSPAHAICINVIEDVLVPASALVNGTTIVQLDVEEATYWHLELECHDIILAENLPAESYLEMGNRTFFMENEVTALGAVPDTPITAAERTHAEYCRPFHTGGPLVDAIRQQIRTRSHCMGWRLDESPLGDLHLVVDGVRVEPIARGLVARFAVPAGADDVWLVSNTSRPIDITGAPDDRDLGACIGGFSIDDGFAAPYKIDLADPLLSVGFYPLEDGCHRWTSGGAHLPAALWADKSDGFFLRVDLAGPAVPRWVAPDAKPYASPASAHSSRGLAVVGE